MKLYELPRNSWFLLAVNIDAGPFKFDHLDGMYSVCWYKGQITHIAAAADVIQIDEPKELTCS